MTFCCRLFCMKRMAAASSIWASPFLFAFSLFNEANVQIFAASRASSKIRCNRVRATLAAACYGVGEIPMRGAGGACTYQLSICI